MKCPFCKHDETQVIDTRLSEDEFTVKRRRKCLSCDRRFNTFERIDLQLPAVVKSDGSREEYDDSKVRNSFMKALHKRPVSISAVDNAIDAVRSNILLTGEREIVSRRIGDMVMDQLAVLDTVAYIRFASIYRSFQDVTDFTAIIQQVNK